MYYSGLIVFPTQTCYDIFDYNFCLSLCVFKQDLQQILHEESCNDAAEGWQFVRRTDLAEIWKKTDDASPIQLIKVFTMKPHHVWCEG